MPKEEPIDAPGERLENIMDIRDDLMDLVGGSTDLLHCKRCNTSFDSEAEIGVHEQKCAKLKPHVCDICGAGFSRISTKQHHQSVHTNERPFSCPICLRTFRLNRMLKAHLPTHEFERPRDFACTQCDKTYMNAKGLEQHITLTHKEKTHQCKICNKMFAQSQKLKRHLSFHLDIRQFPCSDCGFKFKTAHALKRHHWVHNKLSVDGVTCEICGKHVADSGRLKEHMRRKHSDKPKEIFSCDICDVKVSSKTSLSEHKLRHLGIKRFQCPDCDKKFIDARSLRSHSATHSDKREFKCTHCDKDFKWLTNLKEHINDMHTITELKFSCPSCDMKFKTARYLKRHQRIHENRERKFICQQCKKGFTSQNILTNHMKIHNDVRPFSCEMCQKTFRTKSTLADHMITHTGERAFACTYCDKRFGYSSALVKHIRTHTGERPYVCFICQEGFLEPKPLHMHMEKVHGATDSKPKKLFKCTRCYKKLCSKGSLETHMSTHTDNSEFKCTVCFKIFACRSSMKIHMRNQHDAKVPEHKCTVCHKKYVNAKDLERHMNAMHTYRNRSTKSKDIREETSMTHHMNREKDTNGSMIQQHVESTNDHTEDVGPTQQRESNNDLAHGPNNKAHSHTKVNPDKYTMHSPSKLGINFTSNSISQPRIGDELFEENNPDMSKENLIKTCLKTKCFVKLNRIIVPFIRDEPTSPDDPFDSNLTKTANSDNVEENDPRETNQAINNNKSDIVVKNFEIKSEPDENTVNDVVKIENNECTCDSHQKGVVADICHVSPVSHHNEALVPADTTLVQPESAGNTGLENHHSQRGCTSRQLKDSVDAAYHKTLDDKAFIRVPQTFLVKEEV